MTDLRTVPNRARQPARHHRGTQRPAPRHNRPVYMPKRPVQGRAPQRKKRHLHIWVMVIPFGLFSLFVMAVAGGILALHLSFANKILPRVSVASVSVGNLTKEQASEVLRQSWDTISLTDGSEQYAVRATELGIRLNVAETVERAFAQGHGEGGWTALFQDVAVAPVLQLDDAMMREHLTSLASTIERPAKNAGVAYVDGVVQATPPENGTMIDVGATVEAVRTMPDMLTDGILELEMISVAPDVLDATPIIAQATALLSSPLDIRVYDPVTGDSAYWSALPDQWNHWLVAQSDPQSAIGLSLSVEEAPVRAYLDAQVASNFDSSRTLDFDRTVAAIQQAVSSRQINDIVAYVQHQNRQHTVRAGETITSIAWDYGIPYLYIVQANNGLDSISAGQVITIPAADTFITLPPNPNKRIVVSISQQRTYVYENGQLIHEWPTSTGISSSPTWTGVYQVLSHEPNAYAGNWNLYMPNFMGVYQPVPGSTFTNGFHGFPTRGGGQLLWENSLGTPVTYGCILLSNTNIRILYDWAEAGVVVEIRA